MGHGHTHQHPLESITHVHGGAMVLDIGGSVGALHVVLDEEWVGRELFLTTDDPAFSVATPGCGCATSTASTWRRRCSPSSRSGRTACSAPTAQSLRPSQVRGGEVVDVDLRRRCSGRARRDDRRRRHHPRTWQRARPWCHHSRPVHAHSTASRRSSRCLAARSANGVGSSSSAAVAGCDAQVDRRVVEGGDPPDDLVGVARPDRAELVGGEVAWLALVDRPLRVVAERWGADQRKVREALVQRSARRRADPPCPPATRHPWSASLAR